MPRVGGPPEMLPVADRDGVTVSDAVRTCAWARVADRDGVTVAVALR
jgi:hypothetical protein